MLTKSQTVFINNFEKPKQHITKIPHGMQDSHEEDSTQPLTQDRDPYTVIRRTDGKGHGNAGIYLVKHSVTNQLAICKIVDIYAEWSVNAHRTESSILYRLKDHPNVVNIIGHTGEPNFKLYLECCQGGNLERVAKTYRRVSQRIPEAFLWHVAESLARAVCTAHMGVLPNDESLTPQKDWDPIYHNDIITENVFMTLSVSNQDIYPRIVLGDFGGGKTNIPADDLNEHRNTSIRDIMGIMDTIVRLSDAYPGPEGPILPGYPYSLELAQLIRKYEVNREDIDRETGPAITLLKDIWEARTAVRARIPMGPLIEDFSRDGVGSWVDEDHQMTWDVATRQAPRQTARYYPTPSIALQAHVQDVEVKKLYPRLALFEALSKFKDKNQPRKRSSDPICEARRNFLDAFAYLCDINTGGDTVTAAALQKLSSGNVLWLAANRGIPPHILDYARLILNKLITVTVDNQATLQRTIFELALEKCKPRLDYYKRMAQKYATNCVSLLSERRDHDTGKMGARSYGTQMLMLEVKHLQAKLRELSEPPPYWTMETHVTFCYDMRNSEYHHIKRYSSNARDVFGSLAHFIWRLGETRESAKTVVEAMITVPSLRRVNNILVVKAPKIIKRTIDPSCMSPHEVLHEIIDSVSSSPIHHMHAFTRLHELDSPIPGPLHTQMTSRSSVKTKVHAELQIADLFSKTGNRKFVDGDKYIGCSKPACYFCYSWLIEHPHRFVPPATHHKIILACRGPSDSLKNLDQQEAELIVDMYSKMNQQIGQDIINFLQNNGRRRSQHMSPDG
ncbi:unnamed protein product [Periconia digitata]|uniref:Protein kinase domain-containing protein n=1 Tax=Periconia digitata TaxID=1303443 RepID=A0A9W4U9B5_9PLEO|nr:unnamed protein product [Periconia digitata]